MQGVLPGVGTNYLELIALRSQLIGVATEEYTWNCNSSELQPKELQSLKIAAFWVTKRYLQGVINVVYFKTIITAHTSLSYNLLLILVSIFNTYPTFFVVVTWCSPSVDANADVSSTTVYGRGSLLAEMWLVKVVCLLSYSMHIRLITYKIYLLHVCTPRYISTYIIYRT